MNVLRQASLECLAALVVVAGAAVSGQVILSDNYNVNANGTGFALGQGVNTGINLPTTRLTGTAAVNLRYIQTFTSKPARQFDISSSRLRVTKAPDAW